MLEVLKLFINIFVFEKFGWMSRSTNKGTLRKDPSLKTMLLKTDPKWLRQTTWASGRPVNACHRSWLSLGSAISERQVSEPNNEMPILSVDWQIVFQLVNHRWYWFLCRFTAMSRGEVLDSPYIQIRDPTSK